ncbi:hypothetical protein RB597_003322 [Gaeumannomyces tritici]
MAGGTPHLSGEDRQRIRTLYFDGSLSKQDIALRTGFTRFQIRNAIKAAESEPKPRPGRPPLLTKEHEEELLRYVASDAGRGQSYINIARSIFNGRFGEVAIRNALRRRGIIRGTRKFLANPPPPSKLNAASTIRVWQASIDEPPPPPRPAQLAPRPQALPPAQPIVQRLGYVPGGVTLSPPLPPAMLPPMPASIRVAIRIGADQPPVTVRAAPLTAVGYAQFGDVIENPRPEMHPAAFATAVSQQQHLGIIPHAPVVANQGSAIKYQHPTHPLNFYPHAPSQVQGHAVINMFSCAARKLETEAGTREVRSARQSSEVETKDSIVVELSDNDEENASDAEVDEERESTVDRESTEVRDVVEVASGDRVATNPRRGPCGVFPVLVLERHPFTTQTFVPMSRDGADTRYLVIVAPSLEPSSQDAGLPVPIPPPNATGGPQLPGRGLPNLSQMRAFVATGSQAVTYGAGTWHAPMVALGAEGSVVDFFVVQYANGIPIEDCQEALLLTPQNPAPGPSADGEGARGPSQQIGIFVQVPPEYLAAQRSDTRGASKL